MTEWYDIIDNEIGMLIKSNNDDELYKKVIGRVYAGYRYQDGIVSIHGNDGNDYSCATTSRDFFKIENTINVELENMNFNVEIYNAEGNNWLYISAEGDSGCKYQINSYDEAAGYIKSYMENMLESNY